MKTTLFTCALASRHCWPVPPWRATTPALTRLTTRCMPTRTAMVASRGPRRRAAGAERSGEWFDKLDQNKDGYVTQDEMKQARETRHAMRGDMKEKMEERFKEADANSDGQLSLDEVQAKMPRLAERFSTLDADKNGMLSKEEIRNGAPAHGKRPEPKT